MLFADAEELHEHLHRVLELLLELLLFLILPRLIQRAHLGAHCRNLRLQFGIEAVQVRGESAHFGWINDGFRHGCGSDRQYYGFTVSNWSISLHTSPCLIDGRLVTDCDGDLLDVRNPATDTIVGRVPMCSAATAASAADAAVRAFDSWKRTTAAERARLLRSVAARVRADRDVFAKTITLECGKPILEARGEVEYSATFFDAAASAGELLEGSIIASRIADRRVFAVREALGATMAVTPWNFPLAMIARKVGPALAAGCTQVVKPSEETPLSASLLAECMIACGIPNGVFNVVTGDAVTVVGALLAHTGIRKLSFTGSTEVGRILARQASERLVKCALELGGNAPFIVFADADLARAADQLIAAKFRFMGQTCISANRVFVERSVLAQFTALIETRMDALTMGDPMDERTRIGPLINDDAIAKVERHVRDAVAQGARLRRGGKVASLEGLSRRFIEPTLLDGGASTMACSCEETFGPVLVLHAFDTEAEVIASANAVASGLAAYVMTQDSDRLWRVVEQIDAGVIGANDGAPSAAEAPFGGFKDSGYGKEGGRIGVEEYTRVKYVSMRVRGA